MRTYENKDELKNEINKSFAKYISEFDIIPESLKVESAWRIISMVYRYICLSVVAGVERYAEREY